MTTSHDGTVSTGRSDRDTFVGNAINYKEGVIVKAVDLSEAFLFHDVAHLASNVPLLFGKGVFDHPGNHSFQVGI